MTSEVADAVALHKQGNLKKASQAYQKILKKTPHNADVLNYFGMLEFQRGNSDRGIKMAERCLALDPEHASACNNLANMYLTTYRVDDAERYYRKAIELDDQAVQPLHNLAVIEKTRKNYEAAEAYFNRVLSIDPQYTITLSGLAAMYVRLGQYEPALALLKTSLNCQTKQDDQKASLQSIARICLLLDKKDDAIEIYDKWLTLFPDDPTATHMLAALSGDEVPDKPDERYIKELFNRFSSTFDNVLSNLDYQAPQHIQAIVEDNYHDTAKDSLIIVDAGCGTGLCGHFLQPLASCLIGVDLSPGMLQWAEYRKLYDELIEQDLNDYFKGLSDTVDLIVSADTLCYFGDLLNFLRVSVVSLKAGGCLIFTVERHDGTSSTGYHLEAHGRYSHTLEYLNDSIHTAGYDTDAILERDLRMERGLAVKGYLVVVKKPAGA